MATKRIARENDEDRVLDKLELSLKTVQRGQILTRLTQEWNNLVRSQAECRLQTNASPDSSCKATAKQQLIRHSPTMITEYDHSSEEAWRDLELPTRSKASLGSKLQGIKIQPTTSPDNDLAEAQRGTGKSSDNTIPTPPYTTSVSPPMDPSDKGVIDTGEVNPLNVARQPDKDNTADPTMKDLTTTFKTLAKKTRKIGCLPNIRKPPERVSGKHIKPLISQVNKLITDKIEWRKEKTLSWD